MFAVFTTYRRQMTCKWLNKLGDEILFFVLFCIILYRNEKNGKSFFAISFMDGIASIFDDDGNGCTIMWIETRVFLSVAEHKVRFLKFTHGNFDSDLCIQRCDHNNIKYSKITLPDCQVETIIVKCT